MADTKIRNSVFVFLFAGILFVPTIFSVLTDDQEASEEENRMLTKWEDVLLKENINKKLREFDSYTNDQFGLRQFYLDIHDYIKHLTPNPFNNRFKALMGKEDWAFFEGSVDAYQGRINEESIDRFIDGISSFVQSVKPVPVVMIIVPNKTFIYDQFLPDIVSPSMQRHETISKLKNVNGLHLIDLMEPIKNEPAQTFIKYDTHWNGWGAYVAYKEVINTLNQTFSWPLIIKKDIKEISETPCYEGDIVRMLGRQGKLCEANNKVYFKKPHAKAINKHFPTKAQISDFKNPMGWGKVLVAHDSFMQHHLGRYMSESFKEMINVWSFDFKKVAEYADEVKPDFIMIQVVDRHIQK